MADTERSTSSVNTDSIIKVSGSSNPQSVGSILARAISAGHIPKMRAIGASAVNQAVKACAIARGFVAPRGLDVSYIIGFDDIIGDNGDQISAMFFKPVVR
jgi:stage V sporulation protein S